MIITIYGLDRDYKDCALEMGATISEHQCTTDIDCEFPEGVNMFTNHDATVSFTNDTVGMVLDNTEFLSIKIV